MKKIIFISFIIFLSYSVQAQFVQNNARSLFSDVKAFQVNDAVSVFIIEDTQADNSTSTESGRSSDIGAGLSGSAGSAGTNIQGGINTGNDFRGSGKTNKKERIRAKLSAKVVEVVDNGNLRIEGTKTTKINGETSTVKIQGVVRPVDINSDNSVYSYDIMDLTLEIEGEGIISEQQEPGLFTKFLRFLF